MKVIVKDMRDINESETSAWTALRAGNPALYSPYFHVGYAQMVASLRGDVHLAIAYDLENRATAFFPFEGRAAGGGFARPVGAPMTDYHGVIAGPDFGPQHMLELLRAAGIGALDYSAWAGFAPATAYQRHNEPACVMDMTQGVENWRNQRGGSYRRHLKSNRRRIRKAEEEIGPRRFEFLSKNPEIFDTLINWKRKKFAQTGKYDVLSAGWTLDMLKALWAKDDNAALRCDMHAMFFGDQLAAVDLGLTDGTCFHSWMVAYRDDFHYLGPGIQLLESLLDQAASLGYSRLDLGAGLDGYKHHYGTEAIEVQSGFVALRGPAARLSQIYGAAERLGEKTMSDLPGKLRRRYCQIAACDETLSGRTRAMFEAVKTRGGTG